MAKNNSTAIMDRYKKYITSEQRNKLRALYGNLQRASADERRDAYLEARKAYGQYNESASAYGLGRGYLERKKGKLEESFDKYNEQLNRSVDASFEGSVKQEANATIKAQNAAARAAYAKKKADAEAASSTYNKKPEAPVEFDRFRDGTPADRDYQLDDGMRRWLRYDNPRVYESRDDVQPHPFSVPVERDIPTAFWQETESRVYKLDQLPPLNGEGIPPAVIPPDKMEYVYRRSEAINQGGVYLSQFKTEYAQKMVQYLEAREHYRGYLNQYTELYYMQQEYNELARIANDPSYLEADRRRAAEEAQKISVKYNASPIVRDFDRYKGAVDQFYARLYGLAEELQLYRAILRVSGIDYDANAILSDARWIADNGGSIPLAADDEFLNKAKNANIEWDAQKQRFTFDAETRAWASEHGYGEVVDKVLTEFTKNPVFSGQQGQGDRLAGITLYSLAKKYGLAPDDRHYNAGGYYQETYKASHSLDMPENDPTYQKRGHTKLDTGADTYGLSQKTIENATVVERAATNKDGLLYGLFGEKSLLRFGNNGAVSEILENLVVPAAFLRSRDSGKDLFNAYGDSYRRGMEAQRRMDEEGYEPTEEDYYAIDEAKQWDYLNYLIMSGDEYHARLLAIQLLDSYYGRLVHAENAETSDFGLWLKNEFAAVQGNITKMEDALSPVATSRRKSSAVNQEYARRVAEKWVANAKTEQGKKNAEWWANVWTSSWTSLADNAPARLAGMIPYAGKWISGSMFFLSAGGGAYQEALRSGYDPVNAYAYGLAIGASETCLEKLIGGIPLGGKSTLGSAMEALVDKIPKAWLRVIADMGVDMASECTEEYLQEVLEPLFKNWLLGEHNDVKFFTEEALAAGISGALSAALGGSRQRAGQMVKNTATIGKLMSQYNVSRKDAELILKVQQQGLGKVSAKEQERYTDIMAGIQFGEVAPDVGQNRYKAEITPVEAEAIDSTEEYTRLMKEGKRREAEDLLLKKEVSYTDGDMNVVTVDGKTLDVKNMTSRQRALYALTKQLAKAFPNVKVYMHDTLPESNGVNTDRGSIHIALDAQTKYDGQVASYVLSHEFAHLLKRNNPAAWNDMKKSLETFFNSEAQGEAGKIAIARAEQAALNDVMRGRTEANAEAELTAEEADLKDDEYVSGLIEQLFKSPEDMKAFLDGIINDREMAEPHKKTILDTIRKIIDKIKAVFGKTGRTIPTEMRKCMDEVRAAFESMGTTEDGGKNEEIRFSYREAKAIGYNNLLEQFFNKTLSRSNPIYIGEYPNITLSFFDSDAPLMIVASDLTKSTRAKKDNSRSAHGMTKEFLETLPEKITESCIGYTEDRAGVDSFTIVVFDESSNSLYAVGGELNAEYEGETVNKVRSIFEIGSPEQFLAKEGKNLVSTDKKTAKNILEKAGIQSPALQDILNRMRIVQEITENVNTPNRSSNRETAAYNRTAVLEESTVDTWLRDYASSNPDYAQAYIVWMNPERFLELTTSNAGREYIRKGSKPLNAEEFIKATRNNPLQLSINSETGEVEGHEGRHRSVALNAEGIERVPVLLFDSSNKYTKQHMDRLDLIGQDFGNGNRSTANVTVHDVIPLSRANRDEIVKKFTTVPYTEKLKTEYNGTESLRFSSRDAEYMPLAEKYRDGTASAEDINALNKAVEEAARKAGYVLSAYHGTSESFTKFMRGYEGIHLGGKDVAEQVAKSRYKNRSQYTNYNWADIKDRIEEMDDKARESLAQQAYFLNDYYPGGENAIPFEGDIKDANAVRNYVEKTVKALNITDGNPNFRMLTFDRKVGERIMHLYARISKPLTVNGDIQYWNPQSIASVLLMRNEGAESAEFYRTVDITGSKVSLTPYMKHNLQGIIDGNVKGDDAWRVLSNVLERLGYDGIKYLNQYEGDKNSYSYIALNPSDVKSADPVTYDSDGNIIPLSERFRTDREGNEAWKNEDIRYSTRDAAYLSLAEKYRDGTATEEETKELERQVQEAAKKAFPKSVLIQDGIFRKMWHHTNKEFTSFLPGTSPSSGGLKGIYFTPQETSTTSALGNVHKAYYLDVENMKFAFGVEADRKYVDQLRELQKGVTDREQLAEINRKFREETGIDAFFDWQNGWYNVLAPELVKSADPVTYDNNGNIIPLTERFRTDRTGEEAWKNEDIRHSSRDAEYLSLAEEYTDHPEYNIDEIRLREMVWDAAKAKGYTYLRNTRHKLNPEGGVPWMMFVEASGKSYDAQRNYGEYAYAATDDGAIDISTIMPDLKRMADEYFDADVDESEIDPDDIVDSAGVWDDANFVQHLWDNYFENIYDTSGKVPAIKTSDGLLVLGRDDSRVKSLDPVTYDDNGDIIPLTERFKEGNEDIRRSSRADDYLAAAPKVDTKAVAEAVKNGNGEVEGRYTVSVERTEDNRYSVTVEDTETGEAFTRKGRKSVNATDADIEKTASALLMSIKAAEQEDNARLAERMHEGAIRAQERRKADERETDLKEHYQERIRKMNTERLRREVKDTAMNWNKKLVKMLANPTENRHVPLQLAREVAEFTGMLTDYIDGNTKRGQATLDKIMKAYEKAFDDEAVVERAKGEDPDYAPRGQILDKTMYDKQLVKMMQVLNELMTEKSFAELTRSEMELLLNTVRGVVHTVTEANKLIGETEKRTVWEVGDKVIRQVESSPKIPKGIRGYLLASLDLRRIARIFSGSREDAEFVKLVDQLNEGAIEKERVAQELQAMFKAVTDKYGDEIKKWYGKKAEWIDTGVKKNGLPVKITKGMRVSLALHVLNKGNMRHIERGGLKIPNAQLYAKGDLAAAYANGRLVRLTAEQINEIISHMTEAEKAYVEAAKEFFHDRTGYYVNKTSLQLVGYTKANVENYFPIHTDKNFTKTDFDALKVDGSIEGQGFLKERVTATNPVYLEDITSVVNRQIRGVALYAGLAIPMRNFNAVMNVREYEDEDGVWSPRTTVRETLASDRGVGTYGAKVVEGFLKDLSEMSHVDVTPSERLVGKLGTNYVKAVLLGNAKVAMKQTASYPTAAAVIPWKYLGKALVAGGKNKRIISRADVELINKYTPLYEMRREGNANEIASIMNKPGLEQKLPGLLGWITKMDVMTVGRLWSAAEYMVADQQKNLEVGSDEYYREVAKVFNRTIQQTQPNFTPLQRSAALRSKNPLVRSLTLFGTQRMQNGGIMVEAAMELLQSKGKGREEIAQARTKLGRAVASQIVQNVLLLGMAMLVDVLRGRMKAYQDDDDKELTLESIFKYLGDQFLANFMGSFLGGSEVYEVISNIFKKAQGKSTYDTEFSVPAIDAIESLIKFVEGDIPTVIKYLFSGDHTDTEKKNKAISVSIQLAKVFGYATGIPLENVVKDAFKGIYPAILDHIDRFKTGEMIPWLHQSGRLDNEKTKARYQEWIDSGRKGSVFLAWDKKLKALDSATDKKAAILFSDELTDEEKEMLLRMYDINAFTPAEDVSMEDYDAAKAEYDRYIAARDEMKASLTEAEFAEWSKEHSADFLRYLNSTELSGAQKLALLEAINSASGWQEKLDAIKDADISADVVWNALYNFNYVFKSSDENKKSQQFAAWLDKQSGLTGAQKWALWSVTSSKAAYEKAQSYVSSGLTLDQSWKAMSASRSGLSGAEYHSYLNGLSGVTGKQRFLMVEFNASSSNWLEHADDAHSHGVSYDISWKCAVEYERVTKDEYKGKYKSKKEYIKAFAVRLGLTSSQADALLASFNWA